MRRKLSNSIIALAACCIQCMFPQTAIAQKNKNDSAYTFRSASPGGTGKFYLGREIALVMGASNSAWLDRGSRPREENTQLAIDKISLPPTASIADVGAGTG